MGNAPQNSDQDNRKSFENTKVLDEINNLEISELNFELSNNRLAKKPKKIFQPHKSHYISQYSGQSLGLMEIIKLKYFLNYKDLRSVLNWCRKNEVFIIQQGNKQFVNQWEFILSFYKPFIEHLKRKHKNWKEMFLNYLNGQLPNLLTKPNEVNFDNDSTAYSPQTKVETSFLDNIKKL
ncbi:MAG: hypothetical protein ACWA41_04435 [Putridiphycobacter sp.]